MDAKIKRTLIKSLKNLIRYIKSGQCDNMTVEQCDKLIECINVVIEIEQNKTNNRKWYQVF